MDYQVGKFIVVEATDGREEFPALVVGVKKTFSVIDPEKKIRSFTYKDYDPEFFDSEGNRLDGENPKLYILIGKKAPGWNDWYVISTTVQTDLAMAQHQAESWQEAYRENGWSGAVVKVISATDI